MEKAIREFSGRTFSSDDIETIKWVRKTYPKLSRREFAGTICELLEWINQSGRAKIEPCLKLLEALEAEGIIELPKLVQRKRIKIDLSESEIHPDEFNFDTSEVQESGLIELIKANSGAELKRWRGYVGKYHMLGYKQGYGSRIHYFIKMDNREVGCILFSASSWALEEREKWLGWTLADRKARLNLIVNNSRYLIFPWVKIKNLASRVLALAAKQIQEDWLREYCYAPVLLETFVDTEYFKGTCYKAANWIYLGETKGRGRQDRKNEYALTKKAIYMYPLQKDFKEVLRGEKPYKAVNPDDV